MSTPTKVMGRGTHLRVLIAAVAVIAAFMLLAPRPAHGAVTWKECVDKAFAEYTSCLMESTSWFNRKLCDFDWEIKTTICSAYAIGDIRKAYNEGSPPPS
jgi:hypothetical protein